MERRKLSEPKVEKGTVFKKKTPIVKPVLVKKGEFALHRVEYDANFHAEQRWTYYLGNVSVAYAYRNAKEGLVLRVVTPHIYKKEDCADLDDLEDRLLTELKKAGPSS